MNQALELDADAYATASGLLSVLHKVEHPDEVADHWRALLPDHERALTVYFFAIYATYRTGGPDQRERSVWEFESYPPERTRTFMVLDRVRQVLTDLGREDILQLYPQASGRAIADVEKGLALITGEAEKWGNLTDAVGAAAQNHVAGVLQVWNDLLPELRRYAFVELEPAIIEGFATAS